MRRQVDTVLIKVASRCNLNCDYCYIYNLGDEAWRMSAKRMSSDVRLLVARRLAELSAAQTTAFAVVLHGGEPLLLGAKVLREFFSDLRCRLSSSRTPISIQTNGTLISDELLDACAEFQVTLSISLDGPADVHDRHRVDHSAHGSHAAVCAAVQRIQAHPAGRDLFSGVLAVVDPHSVPAEVYKFFKELRVPSVDFLYRDGNHNKLPPGKVSHHSVEYGRWLEAILELYLDDQSPSFRIRVLDDLIRLVLGGPAQKEGVGLNDFGILVIDTDGNIHKNDTLKSAYAGADRFGDRWSLKGYSLTSVISSSEFDEYCIRQRPACRQCLGCAELSVCGGGMVAHRFSHITGYDNPTIYCADQLLVINAVRDRLARHALRRAATA